MSRALWLPDVLADAFRGVKGYQVEVYPGWDDRGRATDFNPFHRDHGGVLNHHTGAGTFDALLRYMAITSRIAPLCHWSTSRPLDGIVRIVVVAAGRANHAGIGGRGNGGTPWVPTNHGNTYLVGGEHQNDGTQPWPGQQNEAIHTGSAAILRHLGHDETRAIDHKHYAPRRKVDRHSVLLAAEQAAIARYLTRTAPTTQEIDVDWTSLIRAAFEAKHPDGLTAEHKAKIWYWGDVLVGKAVMGDNPWGGYLYIKAHEPDLLDEASA